MKKIILMAGLAVLAFGCTTEEDAVESLLKQMTLEEKIGQLNQYTSRWEMTGPAPAGEYEQEAQKLMEQGRMGSMLNVVGAEATRKAQKLAVENHRLGIPMIFGYDVIHGYRTMFPVPLAEAASWEPEIAELTSRVAAIEAAAAGLHWTFAPMVDIARDARWGRIVEGAGEDPYLASLFAAARVRGFQGEDLADNNSIAACAKHFAAYGFAEAGRDYNTVDLSEHTMENMILPPFKACVDAGVASFMTSFNDIGGVPSTGNKALLRGKLKDDWGFEGFVVSDWNSVGELIQHGVAENLKEAARLSLEAGCDMDMEGYSYVNYLQELVDEGKLDESLIDDAVRRILRIKEELGLLEDPYRYCNEELEKEMLLHPDHLALAREAARLSFVLLKNENSILPLEKDGMKITLIGELAADKDSPLGSWRANALNGSAVSVLEGMKEALGSSSLVFEKGPDFIISETSFGQAPKINTTDPSGIKEAVRAARQSDVAVLVLGENCFQSAEGRSVSDIRLKGLQEDLLDAVLEVNPNVVVVLMNGRPMDLSAYIDRIPALLVAWHAGSEAGHALADVIFGDYAPSGRLPVSWPRSLGQLPLYYNHKNTGRPYVGGEDYFKSRYIDQSNDPLFPFGHGLTYTSFEYSELEIQDSILGDGEKLQISISLTNAGDRFGEEVVQLYTRDITGSVSRPVRELKGFRKVGLEPGESTKIKLTLSKEDLYYFGATGQWGVEPGSMKLWVGPSAAEGLEATFIIE